MSVNEFMKVNFPKKNGKNYSFYEIFEIQSLVFDFFRDYSRFDKQNGRIPVYDEKHNIVLNNFSKEEFVTFIERNYIFLRNYSFLSTFGAILPIGVVIHFFIFEF